MATSGTYNFTLANSDIVLEAFERALIAPTEITSRHMITARRSLNLELQTWSNKGPNLPYIYLYNIPLVQGQATYTLPVTTISVLDVYFSTPQTTPANTFIDRIMEPISRDDYAAFPNKSQQGFPTTYWFNRVNIPTLTVYQTPNVSAPYAINLYVMRQVQDANLGMGETPDINYRFQDALCARLAARLAEKFPKAQWPNREKELMAKAQAAWAEASAEDVEKVTLHIQPDVSPYWQQ